MFSQGCHALTLAGTRVSLDGNLTETYKKVVRFRPGGVRTTIAMHYGIRISKMATKAS